MCPLSSQADHRDRRHADPEAFRQRSEFDTCAPKGADRNDVILSEFGESMCRSDVSRTVQYIVRVLVVLRGSDVLKILRPVIEFISVPMVVLHSIRLRPKKGSGHQRVNRDFLGPESEIKANAGIGARRIWREWFVIAPDATLRTRVVTGVTGDFAPLFHGFKYNAAAMPARG